MNMKCLLSLMPCLLSLMVMMPCALSAAEVSLALPVFLPDGQEFKTWIPRLEFSRTYHVNQQHPKASDQNPGTADLPFRTIRRAAELLQPGERVVVAAGIYREHVAPARGGTGPDRMISYEAEAGAEVVIKGSEVASGEWKQAEGWRGLDQSGKAKVWRISLKPEWFAGYNPFAIINLPRLAAQDCFTPKPQLMPGLLSRRGLVFQHGRLLRQVSQPGKLAEADGTYWAEWNGQALYVRPYGEPVPEFCYAAWALSVGSMFDVSGCDVVRSGCDQVVAAIPVCICVQNCVQVRVKQ